MVSNLVSNQLNQLIWMSFWQISNFQGYTVTSLVTVKAWDIIHSKTSTNYFHLENYKNLATENKVITQKATDVMRDDAALQLCSL